MSTPRRILVVEDDPRVGAGVARALRATGFEVELLSDLGPARARLKRPPPLQLLVLDLCLPGGDGMALLDCGGGVPPVLVLTARVDVHTRLSVFERGAVDYLAKPFFMEELVARVRARLAPTEEPPPTQLTWGRVTLDVPGRRALVDGRDVGLTRVELDLLVFLHARRGRAVARDELAARVLPGGDEASSRTVDAHIARVRQKLGDDSRAIVTVWGIGYRFDPDELAPSHS